MKICMAGALGRVGRRILEIAEAAEDSEVGSAFDVPESSGTEVTIGGESGHPRVITLAANAAEAMAESDVLIDFTLAHACVANVRAASEAGKSSVIGTTGLSAEQKIELKDLASDVPIVFAPNMSVGVNILFKLTSEVASILGLDYNVEIIDIHHNTKQDAPSGTAVRLAERAAEALGLDYDKDVAHGREGMIGERPRGQIGVHTLRGGDVVGEHTVSFIGEGERVEITHRAHSRDNFARGALRAARWTADAKPGLYDMQDVLGLK